jgi:coiled-coil domain-containing protein 39
MDEEKGGEAFGDAQGFDGFEGNDLGQGSVVIGDEAFGGQDEGLFEEGMPMMDAGEQGFVGQMGEGSQVMGDNGMVYGNPIMGEGSQEAFGEESNPINNGMQGGNEDMDVGDNGDIIGFDNEEDVNLPGVDDLPLFANPEARKVDLDIKEKEESIELIIDKISDMKERVKVMKEHFKNVQQELEHTNNLYNAKRAEIQTEEHLKQLTSRALGRSQLETKQAQAKLEEVQNLLNTTQTDIYHANEKMDEFKMQMNWNQEELEQWAVAARQKEEDNIALQKYTRADELKIKELSMQLEQFTKERVTQKALLETEVTETQAKQMELDRIAQEFEQSHGERRSLVERWQETVQEMKKRDQEISELGERYAVAKGARLKKEHLLTTQQKRLKAQQFENQEVEGKSETLGRIVSRKREEMMSGSRKLQDFRDELESLKNELMTAAESLVTKRSENSNQAAANEEKKIALERERQKYQQATEKLELAKKSTRTAEQVALDAEQGLKEKENEFNNIIGRIKILKDKLLKESQAVYDLKREEKKLSADVHGSKSTSKNLEGQLTQLDREAARQQELLYSAEFQIQQIERKIARGMGERSDEEKRALKAQIEECESRHEMAKEKRKMLQQQVRKLANELTTYKNRRDRLKETKIELTEKQGELELQARMIEEELKKETRVKEDVVVANDLMRLEVRRLKDLLSAKADAVFSLENRRQQLLLSMEERKQEISVHRDVLRADHRTANEEKHKCTMDLRDREKKVDILKARFDAVARGPDEGHSQSYYIIKAAQQREEMQRKGDELDQDIKRQEREIRALQTTLDHLNARNNAYRNSFQKVDLHGTDVEVLRQLEERTKLGKDALFKKKKELQRIVTDFEEDSRRLEQVKQQVDKLEGNKEHLMNAKVQVSDELAVQEAQLSELTDRCERVVNKHRDARAQELGTSVETFANGGTLEEKSVRAEVLKDVTQNVLYTLSQLSIEFPEVSDELHNRAVEASLRIPTKPPPKSLYSTNISSRQNARAAAGGRPGTGGSENNSRQGNRSALPTSTFDIEGLQM